MGRENNLEMPFVEKAWVNASGKRPVDFDFPHCRGRRKP
jgi:hypothetical protein